MADHARLEQALVEFTRLLHDEFAVKDVLQRLCEHAGRVVPVFGAGVAVHGPDAVRVLATVGAHVSELEDLQVRLGEGPCREAVAEDRSVTATLPGVDDERWPAYSLEAVRIGVRTLAAIPLRAQDVVLGALDVYSDQLAPFSRDDLDALQVLADAAAAFLVAAWDRERRQAAESDLRFQSLHDPLTGLPNRVLLADQLSHAIRRLPRGSTELGVLFVDLNRFKQVNDAHGHAAGDRLLAAVARRLEGAIRRSDSLGRMGGDEFLVVCEDLEDGKTDLLVAAGRISNALHQPFSMPDGDLIVGCSIGGALATAHDTWETLLRDADRAMYVAKGHGGGTVISEREADGRTAEAIRTEVELRQAVERAEIRAWFQPVVNLKNDDLAGFEALARWDHPRHGLLPASAFVPLAETTGLIIPLGMSIFRQVCEALRQTQKSKLAGVYVAINLSGRELRNPRVVERIQTAIDSAALDPRRLIVEVTESSLIRRGEGLEEILALADLGLKVAIDDFGTGYSTLAYLTDLPAAVVKLDKLFVDRIGTGAKNEALLRSMIAIAHDLGLVTVAEGIETQIQHQFLVANDCDFGQGHFYGRPAPSILYQRVSRLVPPQRS